jgi:hypothetical protein
MHHRDTQEAAVLDLAKILDKTAGMKVAVADRDAMRVHGLRDSARVTALEAEGAWTLRSG